MFCLTFKPADEYHLGWFFLPSDFPFLLKELKCHLYEMIWWCAVRGYISLLGSLISWRAMTMVSVPNSIIHYEHHGDEIKHQQIINKTTLFIIIWWYSLILKKMTGLNLSSIKLTAIMLSGINNTLLMWNLNESILYGSLMLCL